MNVESVARHFVEDMGDEKKVKSMLTPDATVDGGVLPQPMPAAQAFHIVEGLSKAMPDFKIDVDDVKVNGDEALVKATWSGTQTKPLNMDLPGMRTIEPTGKKVHVQDAYRLTLKDGKVAHMRVESPQDGGIPAALSQLGVKLPDNM